MDDMEEWDQVITWNGWEDEIPPNEVCMYKTMRNG